MAYGFPRHVAVGPGGGGQESAVPKIALQLTGGSERLSLASFWARAKTVLVVQCSRPRCAVLSHNSSLPEPVYLLGRRR